MLNCATSDTPAAEADASHRQRLIDDPAYARTPDDWPERWRPGGHEQSSARAKEFRRFMDQQKGLDDG